MGGAVIGYLADTTGASALVSWGFVLSSVPVLYLYRTYGHLAMSVNVLLMMTSGFFVNGPYALITTAVSADLVRAAGVKGVAVGGGSAHVHLALAQQQPAGP